MLRRVGIHGPTFGVQWIVVSAYARSTASKVRSNVHSLGDVLRTAVKGGSNKALQSKRRSFL